MALQTIGQVLRKTAEVKPDRVVFTLLADGETQEISLTSSDLDKIARQISVRLQDLGLQGERVLLVFPFCLEFYMAFMGCAYAGAINVLAIPPRPDQPLTPLQNTAADSGAKAVLTTSGFAKALSAQLPNYPGLQSLQWLTVEEIVAKENPERWVDPLLAGETPAVLSYTSGSTNLPKGVLLSNQNILSCMQAFIEKFPPGQEMTWLSSNPIYHIGGVITPVAAFMLESVRVILLPTQLLLIKPSRWLNAVSRYHAQNTGGFAALFQLSMQLSTAERDQLDLRALQHTFLGGESIDSALMGRFLQYFEPAGFRRQTFKPTYGLTEVASIATLADDLRHTAFDRQQLRENRAVPANDKNQDCLDIVSCGKPLLGKIVVANPERCTACKDGEIGEIWIQGPHVGLGYWNQPEETKRTFQAYLQVTGEGPFLRTGDLGFILDGELYITGRIKHVIILHGRNYLATDFESALSFAHPTFVPGGSAAFGINVMGEEQLAIVQEINPGTAATELDQAVVIIRERISKIFEQPVFAVTLVEKGKLPRTATGKIQRYLCLEAFQNGKLPLLKTSLLGQETTVANTARPEERLPRTPVEGALVGIWMGLLKRTDIGIHDNFFALGGNSLQAGQIVSHIRDVFQVELQMQSFFRDPTIAGLAKDIEQARNKPVI